MPISLKYHKITNVFNWKIQRSLIQVQTDMIPKGNKNIEEEDVKMLEI